MTDIKRTPLAGVHEALGAKMVEFAGYWMPVSYGSIIEEHRAVRERVGIFDVSHMGEFMVTGRGAREFINRIITNDCSKLKAGAIQYTVMCTEDGAVVDDLLVSALDDDRFLLVVNASNIEKDWEHVSGFERDDVRLENVSDEFALLAVQGPKCREVLAACPLFDNVKQQFDTISYYHGFSFDYEGAEILVSRTGYTGELGFEIFLPPAKAPLFWNEIVRAGEIHGLAPIGLGARDTLRFEAAYCLYGHELDEETSPLEAGLGWVVKLKKEQPFRGIEKLKKEKENGPARALVGFELEGRNIARQGYTVLGSGEVVGRVTSGAFSPTLEKSLCMAYIKREAKTAEGQFEIEIRNKKVPARLTPLPFYKSRSK